MKTVPPTPSGSPEKKQSGTRVEGEPRYMMLRWLARRIPVPKRIARRIRTAARIQAIVLARKLLPLKRYAARRLGAPRRATGVNLVAHIRAEMGLGQAGRGLADALEAARLPFAIINLERGIAVRHGDMSWTHKEVAHSNFGVTVVSVNPDHRNKVKTDVPRSVLDGSYLIGNWFWELPELPREWARELSFYDEIWAPSRFIQQTVARDARIPVVYIPPVVKVELTRRFSREYFGLPRDRFLFLAMADTRSAFARKNPLAALQAFKKAFTPNDEKVALVLKFNNIDYKQSSIRILREQADGWSNIIFLDHVFNREEVYGLIASSDCFISLHRAEGFGLPPAEAMSLGKPAILTNWSGNTDYMTDDNCAAIGYQFVQVDSDFSIYGDDQYWADPDVNEAAAWMRRLSDDCDLAAALGRRGQQTIRNNHSPESVGKLITQRLEAMAGILGV